MPTLARTVLDTQLGRGRTATKAVTSYQAPWSIYHQRVGRGPALRHPAVRPGTPAGAIARAERATLNDVLLAICAGGLRRFLTDLDALPDRPLVAFVSRKRARRGQLGGGNAVGATLVSLATEVEDPVARPAAIRASSRAAKARMAGMSADSVMAYSAMLLAPAALQVVRAMTGIPLPVPQTLNVCVSNVPGPKEHLYLRGARLEATYPVSIPGHSMALNITAHSYAGNLDVGFIGDHDALAALQRLAVHTGEALDELERAVSGLG